MNELFEYSDTLNSPVEAFSYDTGKNTFPVQSHWHYFMEIVYVTEGSIVTVCNGKSHTMKPGDLMIITPQTIHAFNRTNEPYAKYLVLKFDLNKLSDTESYMPKFNALFLAAGKQPDLPTLFSQADFEDFSLLDLFQSCILETKEKQYGYDSYIKCEISMLLLKILRKWRNCGFCPETDVLSSSDDEYTIHTILEYIDRHSDEAILVEDLAAMCNMSYSYFAKTFRRLYGQSCKQYIEFIRLSKVENYLMFTNYDLNYISNETGFSDCSHLIRVFKRKHGTTPKQFRMKYK